MKIYSEHRSIGRATALSLALFSLSALSGCKEDVTVATTDDTPSAAVTTSKSKTVSFRYNSKDPEGIRDATIDAANPEKNLGGSTRCRVDGDWKDGADLACLMYWDISSIPKGAKVTAVEMQFRVLDGTSKKYPIHEVQKPWVGKEVTWNSSSSNNKWETPGALGKTDRRASVGTITGKLGTRNASLDDGAVEMVQRWVDGKNFGIVIADTEITDGLDLASAQNDIDSDRPKLTVTYK